tara:strand:+ start:949 stop:1098 length:150 start_codon:yes stop_codon:yes gene_type:complete
MIFFAGITASSFDFVKGLNFRVEELENVKLRQKISYTMLSQKRVQIAWK